MRQSRAEWAKRCRAFAVRHPWLFATVLSVAGVAAALLMELLWDRTMIRWSNTIPATTLIVSAFAMTWFGQRKARREAAKDGGS
ncbi:hypothetical protein [Nakamurella sp. PAMC28650]|uniref:hypothetical protein n=1 Tax=Nakamurella sp. PAMC28650 TaxID=2762325 RepID=UPI00164E5CEE|nr:hypothetical protein [Nakamurella sp. PAMC28650]QNK79483.1 hypothetical protein H7F38_14370 [Nakamurella sp. PAMC28650]